MYKYQIGRCASCGFELSVQKHHPDGKFEGKHLCPENWVFLCPLCHDLITRRSWSIAKTGRKVRSFWRKIFSNYNSVELNDEIMLMDGKICICFPLDEILETNDPKISKEQIDKLLREKWDKLNECLIEKMGW